MSNSSNRKRGITDDESEQPLAKQIRDLSLGSLGQPPPSASNYHPTESPFSSSTCSPNQTVPHPPSNHSYASTPLLHHYQVPVTTSQHTYPMYAQTYQQSEPTSTYSSTSYQPQHVVSTENQHSVHNTQSLTVAPHQPYAAPIYQPELSPDQNPEYYSINGVLYEAHMSSLARRKPL